MPNQNRITAKSRFVRDPRLVTMTKLKLENYLLRMEWAALVDLRMSLEQSADRRAA